MCGVVVLLAVVLSGCPALLENAQAIHGDLSAEYVAATTAFTSTVNALADLRAAGTFSVETADHITAVIKAGREALERWDAALDLGTSDTPARDAALDVIQQLGRYVALYQGGQ